jgi:hypothetical protein
MKDLLKLVVVAAVLLGGYIAYDQWRERQECVVLARRFAVNFNSIIGTGVIDEAKREGSQAPMLGVADRVAQNSDVMNQLDAKCPGWREGKYQ